MRELYNLGVKLPEMMNLPIIDKITRMKYIPNDDAKKELGALLSEIEALQADAITNRIGGRMMTNLTDDE